MLDVSSSWLRMTCCPAVFDWHCGACRAEVIWVLRKILIWAVVIFIIYYLATDPTGAGSLLHHAFNGLKEAGQQMTKFVNSL
jgi:hypothetical protein